MAQQRNDRSRRWLAVAVACAAQLVGLAALQVAVANTGVRFNHGQGASCHLLDYPPEVPLRGLESRRFRQSWSWAPPGLVCTTQVAAGTVVVRQPRWRDTAWSLLIMVVAAAGTAVAIGGLAPAGRGLGRLAPWLAALVQPVVLATALAAVAVPAAI